MNEIQQLLQLVAQHFGWQVGDKIKTEINSILALENVDIKELQNRIKTIESILDADPDTEEFDVAQNIITQLTNILTRLTDIENNISDISSRLADVESQNQQQNKRLDDIESQLSNLTSNDTINGIQEEISNIETEIDNIENIIDSKADKTYVDEKFVTKESVTSINVEALANIFRAAMDCGFNGVSLSDCNTNNSNNNPQDNSDNENGDTGDGAVI